MLSPDRGRVTAGIPGLSPLFRQRQTRAEQERERGLRLVQEALERDTITVSDDGGHTTTEIEAQMGRPLTSLQVSERLKKANPWLHFEVSLADAGKMGIYIADRDLEGHLIKRFVCGMEHGWMPEFSVRFVKHNEVPYETGLPDNPIAYRRVPVIAREKRGWRTVLVRLIRERIITYGQADRLFEIVRGRPSANWKLLTQ